MKTEVLKQPEDLCPDMWPSFKRCWYRDSIHDTVWVFGTEMNAQECEMLAKWLLEAAQYMKQWKKQNPLG